MSSPAPNSHQPPQTASLYPSLQSPQFNSNTATLEMNPTTSPQHHMAHHNQQSQQHGSANRIHTPMSKTPSNNRVSNNNALTATDPSLTISTPMRSSATRQQTPLRTNSNTSFIDKENDPGSNRPSTSYSRNKISRRSILKRNPDSIRGPRQSVSFAKQKEVVTFTTEEHRSSCGDESDAPSQQLSDTIVQKLPLSPVSEKNAESSKGSETSSPSRYRLDLNSSKTFPRDFLYLPDEDNVVQFYDTEYSTSISPAQQWDFPLNIGENKVKSKRRSSIVSVTSSPGVFYPRISIGSEASSAATNMSKRLSTTMTQPHDDFDGSLISPELKNSIEIDRNEDSRGSIAERQQRISTQCQEPQQSVSPRGPRRPQFVPAASVNSAPRSSDVLLRKGRQRSSSASISPIRRKTTIGVGQGSHTMITNSNGQEDGQIEDNDVPTELYGNWSKIPEQDDVEMLARADNDHHFNHDVDAFGFKVDIEPQAMSDLPPFEAFEGEFMEDPPLIRPPSDFSLFNRRSDLIIKGQIDDEHNEDATRMARRFTTAEAIRRQSGNENRKVEIVEDVTLIDNDRDDHDVTNGKVPCYGRKESTNSGMGRQHIMRIPRISLSGVEPNLPSAERRAIPNQSLLIDDDDVESDSSEGEALDRNIDGVNGLVNIDDEHLMNEEAEELIEDGLEIKSKVERRKTSATVMEEASIIDESFAHQQQSRISYPTSQPQHVPLSFRTPRIVGIPPPPSSSAQQVQTATVDGKQSIPMIYTPRTATRLRGPFSIVNEGVLERLEDGTGRITPRPEHFDLNTVQLSKIEEQGMMKNNDHLMIQRVRQQEKQQSGMHRQLNVEIKEKQSSCTASMDSVIVTDDDHLHSYLQQKRMSTLHEEQEECDESEATEFKRSGMEDAQGDADVRRTASLQQKNLSQQQSDVTQRQRQLSGSRASQDSAARHSSSSRRNGSPSSLSRRKSRLSHRRSAIPVGEELSESRKSELRMKRQSRLTEEQSGGGRTTDRRTEDLLPPLDLPRSGSSFYYDSETESDESGNYSSSEDERVDQESGTTIQTSILHNDPSMEFLRNIPATIEFGAPPQQLSSSSFTEMSFGNQHLVSKESPILHYTGTTTTVEPSHSTLQETIHDQDIQMQSTPSNPSQTQSSSSVSTTPPRRRQTSGPTTSPARGLLKRISPKRTKRYTDAQPPSAASRQSTVNDSIPEVFAFSPREERQQSSLPESVQQQSTQPHLSINHPHSAHATPGHRSVSGAHDGQTPFESPRFGRRSDSVNSGEHHQGSNNAIMEDLLSGSREAPSTINLHSDSKTTMMLEGSSVKRPQRHERMSMQSNRDSLMETFAIVLREQGVDEAQIQSHLRAYRFNNGNEGIEMVEGEEEDNGVEQISGKERGEELKGPLSQRRNTMGQKSGDEETKNRRFTTDSSRRNKERGLVEEEEELNWRRSAQMRAGKSVQGNEMEENENDVTRMMFDGDQIIGDGVQQKSDEESDAASEMEEPSDGMDWQEFQEVFCGDEFSRMRFQRPYPTLQEIAGRVIEATGDSIEQNDDENDFDDDERDWTLEEVLSPPNIEKMSEYFKKRIELARSRLSSEGKAKRKKRKATMNTFQWETIEKPSVVKAFESFLPKTKGTKEVEEKMEKISECGYNALETYYERETWIEILDDLCGSWEKKFEEVEEKMDGFSKSELARLVQKWGRRYRQGDEEATTRLELFSELMEHRRETAYAVGYARWKLDVKQKQRELMNERIDEGLAKVKVMLERFGELGDLFKREKEMLDAYLEQIQQQTSLQEVTKRAIEQLKQSIKFEKAAAEKSKANAERRNEIIRKLNDGMAKDKEECQRVGAETRAAKWEQRHKKDIIRWAAIEKDVLEVRQRTKGYILEGQDFDSIEVSVTPKVHFNARSQELWLEYLRSDEVKGTIDLRSEDEESGMEFDCLYEAWELRRRKLWEDVEEYEKEQTLENIREKVSALRPLAIPIRPRIRVWWRYDVPTEEETTATGKSTEIFEGMKVDLTSGLCDDVSRYISDGLIMLQPSFDVAQIDDEDLYQQVMKRREQVRPFVRRYVTDESLDQITVTDGLGHLLFEWEIRRLLFRFVEQRLNEKIKNEMTEKGFFKRSPLNALLNSETPAVVSSLDCFAPQFPSAMITDVIALGILHVRCIECLMDQQQQLIRRYPPLGSYGGTEVTYIKRGSPCHDYRRHPISSNTEIQRAEDDQVVFHIDLRNRSLKNLRDFRCLDKATIVIPCNLVFSIATKSWVCGACEDLCTVLIDRKVWDLSDDELESRLNHRDRMIETLKRSIKELKTLTRLPLSSDLVDIVLEAQIAGGLMPQQNKS